MDELRNTPQPSSSAQTTAVNNLQSLTSLDGKNCSGSVPSSVSPKKSARLAEKRKLREEAGPTDDDFYFTPYKFPKSSNSVSPPPSRSSDNSPTKTALNGITNKSSPSSFISPSKLATKSLSSSSIISRCSSPAVSSSSGTSNNTTTKSELPVVLSHLPKKSQDHSQSVHAEESSSDDEKWFDALESGNLDESESSRNQKFLTVRQKAMLYKNNPNYTSPIFDSSPKQGVLTQEMIKIRAEKSERRRMLAQQKKEFDKKKTMDRLLNKQQTKALKPQVRPKFCLKITEPKISYVIGRDLNTISFPTGFDIPTLGKGIKNLIAKEHIMCGVDGCSQRKKYNCSKTNVPLCSLDCYRKNLAKNALQ